MEKLEPQKVYAIEMYPKDEVVNGKYIGFFGGRHMFSGERNYFVRKKKKMVKEDVYIMVSARLMTEKKDRTLTYPDTCSAVMEAVTKKIFDFNQNLRLTKLENKIKQ